MYGFPWGGSRGTDGELEERMTSRLTMAHEDPENDTDVQESSPSSKVGTKRPPDDL